MNDSTDDSEQMLSFLVPLLRQGKRKTLIRALGNNLSLSIAHGSAFAQIAFDFNDTKIGRQMLGNDADEMKQQYLEFLQNLGMQNIFLFLSTFANSPVSPLQ